MANIVNNLGQVLVGFRSPVVAAPVTSSLLTSLFGVWNADTTTTTLATGAYGAWNGEGSVTQAQLQTSVFSAWNADSTNNITVKNAWNGNGDATDSKSGANGTIATPSGTGFVTGSMTFGSGKLGSGAFSFSGTNFISLPADTLSFTNDFSISMWVYIPTSVGSSFVGLISAYDNKTSYTVVKGWRLWFQSNVLHMSIGETYSTSPNETTCSMNLKDQWVHVAVTRVSSSTTTIYINGSQVAQTTNSVNPTYNANNLAYIGAQYYSFSQPYYASLAPSGVKFDAIQTWDTVALDSTAISELYNSGNGQEYPFTISNALIKTPNDALGNYNGTLMNGCTFTTGLIGQAFTFDGVNDYISLPTNSMNFAGDYSISAWIYVPSGYAGTNQIIILCNEYVSTWFNNPYGWYLTTIGDSVYHETHVGTNTTTSLIATHHFTTSAWHHIVYTRKSSTRSRIYIDGNLINSDTNTINPVYSSTHNPTIGTEYLVGAIHDLNVANARIDALTTWSREITSDEVSALYNSASGNQYPFSSVTIGGSNDSVSTHNGTVVGGVTYSTGVIGNAFSFNGTTGYVSLPNNTFNFSGDFSVSAWINISALSSSQDIISAYSNSGSNNYGWDLWGANSVLKFSVYNGTTSQVDLVYSGLSTNTWIHVAVTRKLSTGTKMYINGTLVTSNSSTTNPVYLGTNNADLGAAVYNGSATDFFYGKIDMATVWSKQLTDDEVIQLYNVGSGTQYPFTSPSYLPSVNDAYGTNNGTLMNGCTFAGGKIGQAFTFDGVNDFIQLPSNSLNFTGDFSASAWIYVPTTFTGLNDIYIINSLGCDSWFSNPYGWRFLVIGNQLYFSIFNHTNSYYELIANYIFTNGNTIGNTWYHVAFTRKGSTGSKLYINGSMVASDTNTVNPVYPVNDITPTIGNLYMGTNGSKQNSYFAPAGTKVDSLNIWTRELNSADITSLYNSGSGKQYPNY